MQSIPEMYNPDSHSISQVSLPLPSTWICPWEWNEKKWNEKRVTTADFGLVCHYVQKKQNNNNNKGTNIICRVNW